MHATWLRAPAGRGYGERPRATHTVLPTGLLPAANKNPGRAALDAQKRNAGNPPRAKINLMPNETVPAARCAICAPFV
jgi:hypothetical protein